MSDASSPKSGVAWKSGAASAALHLAVGGAIFGTFAGVRQIPPPQEPAMSIELAPLPSAPPAPPEQVAPGPEQVEVEDVPEPRPEQTVSPPIPVVLAPNAAVVVPDKPRPAPPRPPEPRAEPQVTRPRVEQTTAPAAVPLPAREKAGAPVEGTPKVGDAVAQQTWEGKVLARIERKKRYPRDAQRAGEQDSIFVRISIDRSGNVVQSHIVRSRGIARLDAAALDQIKRAAPFPPPPSSTTGSIIRIVVTINFNL